MPSKMLHDATVHCMFHDFAANGSEQNGMVIAWVCSVTFLKDRNNVGFLPITGN